MRVTTNLPSQVSGKIEERPLKFVSGNGLDHLALLGVRAVATVGSQPLLVTVRSEDGQQVTLSTEIHVVAGDDGYEELHFAPGVSRLLDPELLRKERLRLAKIYAVFTPETCWKGVFDWPFKGPITSPFGTRRRYEGGAITYHAGIDINGEEGDVIRAPAQGVVVLADVLQVSGGAVILDHGAGVLSGHYHLARIDVKEGQTVARGDPLGTMGATGLVTGSHLHWELRVGGMAVNPAEWTQRTFP